ncbi:MAG TPA: ABC transporter permease [Gemmatimonadaceae bacterium]|nr:ABC transporter permease [Gemmatimonadaceae bacterium]
MRNPFSRDAGRLPFQRAPEAEVNEELAFHVEERIRDYVARGMDPEAARAAALQRLGDLRGVRDECTHILAEDRRAEARRSWLADLRQDLRFGVRAALRAPLFSLLAVVTLALGIGANAAVFGVVKSVLLDALPYADADRVVRVYGRLLDGTMDRAPLSAGTITDIAARQRSFSRLAAFNSLPREVVYAADDEPRVLKVEWAEPELFRTLGVSAMLGRTFTEEEAASDTAHVVVLMHAAWQRLFAGDRAVLGRAMRVNGIPRTVIGVLPRDFVGPVSGVDIYFPLNLRPALADPISARRRQWLGLVGRLRPGVTVDAAERELVSIAADLAREYPLDNGSFTVAAVPVRDAMVGATGAPLIVLMASAGLVLLITCANLAGALLARTISRRKEFAVRVALGAGRGRLVRQLLTESLLLAAAGGAAGLLLATLALSALRGLALPSLPEYAALSLDGRAVLVTSIVALGTGVAFGLAPALSVGRWSPQSTLRDETRGASESGRARRLRGMLVAGQIALCVSLLAGAGLLARSLQALTARPLGFRPDGVLAVAVQLPPREYATEEARVRFIEQFEERLRGLPGVGAVATTGELPTRIMNRNGFVVEGAPPPPPDAQPIALYSTVSGDYFRALGIPLLGGRVFGPQDRPDGPPVVVISESIARRYWPGGNAVGGRLRMGPDPNGPLFEVIGVVGDVRDDPAKPEPEPVLYAAMQQAPWNGPIFVLRTDGDPLALVGAVRRELKALDPALPLQEAATLPALLAEGLSARRLPAVLMLSFAGLALLLASIGVYALFASMAAAREREFGVRVALGSSRGAIAALVLRQGAVWMAAGLAGGVIGVVAVARLLRGLLYGVPPFDLIALGAAISMLCGCATVALLVPVLRATRADPVAVLR